MEDKNTFTTVDENGKEIVCEVLFTFESIATNKNYIVYTDNDLDEEGNTKVYASYYDPTGVSKELLPVESEEEWMMISEILDNIQQENMR